MKDLNIYYRQSENSELSPLLSEIRHQFVSWHALRAITSCSEIPLQRGKYLFPHSVRESERELVSS
jgi:hypothetical protein